MTEARRDRLGKGLGALLGQYLDPVADESEVRRIPVGEIVANPLQPRRGFSEEELSELAESIRQNGLLQPLVVRPSPHAASRYELVAGERRFRAISRLDWEDVPVLVRDASDETVLVLALVENLQREALNPLEEADGYNMLGEKFGMTQADIAKAVGKSRSTVANLIRLLKLPPSIRRLLEEGALDTGHARALLSVEDEVRAAELARTAAREGWSVREVEKRVGGATKKPARPRRSSPRRDPVLRAFEEALREALSTRVTIRRGHERKGGAIEITFHGDADLERVFELLTRKRSSEVAG